MNWQVFAVVWAAAITVKFFTIRLDDLGQRVVVVLPWLAAATAAGLIVPLDQTRAALEIFGLALAADLPHAIYIRRREQRILKRVYDELAPLRAGWGQASAVPVAGGETPAEGASDSPGAARATETTRVQ